MKRLAEGLYDELVTLALGERLEEPGVSATVSALGADVAAEVLAKHLARHAATVLASIGGKELEKVGRQVELANRVIDLLAGVDGAAGDGLRSGGAVDSGDRVTAERLLQVLREESVRLGAREIVRPAIPLRHSDLIVNGPQDLRVGREIQRELESADRVDVLVSFVKWTGFVELRDALQRFCDRRVGGGGGDLGGRRLGDEVGDRVGSPSASLSSVGVRVPLRVLTTTYMGATDHEALDALVGMGAEVRVSYDARRTRLHAKAWLFQRETGFSTGIVGSSNLSHAALRDGCEWNVRLSNVDNAPILNKFQATFAQYWDEGAFEPYERERFITVLSARRNPERDALAAAVRLHPYPHQTAVLDALAAEREAGHMRNLVIAATGTGKTVIAALDYKSLGTRPSLLFVAHRKEILEKSRATYRAALGDGGFGELLTGGDKPLVGRHVFASIQSLKGRRLLDLERDAYDVIVVDEFHHAEADTYTELLNHLTPRVLLGLTATPERADGKSVMHWFDGRVAAESRLWDALDQELLVPFQYFGLNDETDLSQIDFRAGRYNVRDLERVYTADEHRARGILKALTQRVRDPTEMRALGFCVSVKHAEFMEAFFNRNGLRAATVTGETPGEERRASVRRLAAGEICALFTVDVFNEGVDIPEVDTVLFLRPTESATLYLQQLGRGLRLHESKSCLTVLDFIGRASRKFRFDRRIRSMLGGGTRAEVRKAVEEGFPRLPSGCSVQLDEASQANVLRNIKETLSQWVHLADDLIEDWPLATFLERADVELSELYSAGKSFSRLREHRGFIGRVADSGIVRALPRMLHVDDGVRLARWRAWLAEEKPPVADVDDAYQLMLFAVLGQAQRPTAELGEFFAELWADREVLSEVRQLMEVLDDRRRKRTYALEGLPFRVHATYSRDEISAGLAQVRKGRLLRTQGGVYKCAPHRCDVLYVTLEKDEKDFTPTTLYNDYPLSQWRFHWESQGKTRLESDTGRRYQAPPVGWRHLLFVRHAKQDARGVTMPYVFLGPVSCESAVGERPIQIVWKLEREMPAAWFSGVKIAAA